MLPGVRGYGSVAKGFPEFSRIKGDRKHKILLEHVGGSVCQDIVRAGIDDVRVLMQKVESGQFELQIIAWQQSIDGAGIPYCKADGVRACRGRMIIGDIAVQGEAPGTIYAGAECGSLRLIAEVLVQGGLFGIIPGESLS